MSFWMFFKKLLLLVSLVFNVVALVMIAIMASTLSDQQTVSATEPESLVAVGDITPRMRSIVEPIIAELSVEYGGEFSDLGIEGLLGVSAQTYDMSGYSLQSQFLLAGYDRDGNLWIVDILNEDGQTDYSVFSGEDMDEFLDF